MLAAVLAGCGGGDDAPAPTAAPTAAPLTCDQLTGTAIPAASIGLPTAGAVVTAASGVAAAGTGAKAIPEYCLVTGTIAPVDTTAPNITFRVALPTIWNSKVVMFGGGGFNGSIPNVAGNVPAGPTDQLVPLGRGYATFASDSGHQANALGSLDGSFGLNDEAVRNFSGDALKKTRDAAVFLIKARYAVELDPEGVLRRRLDRRPRGARSRSRAGPTTGTAPSPGIRRGTSCPRSSAGTA